MNAEIVEMRIEYIRNNVDTVLKAVQDACRGAFAETDIVLTVKHVGDSFHLYWGDILTVGYTFRYLAENDIITGDL